MAFQATFRYNNLDATSDLNLHTRVLVAKGVVSGFDVNPVAGTSNVVVSAGYLVSVDGMIVRSTTVENLACVPGARNNIVFRAVYNSPAEPTLLLQVLSDAQYASDPQLANLVRLAVVDMTAATQVSNSVIDYSTSDRVDVQGRDGFLGTYETSSALSTAYPSSVPTQQRRGDYALVLSDTQAKPALYIWLGTAWITLGNYEDLLLAYNLHTSGVVGSGLTIHVTSSEKAALAGTAGTPGATNRFVTETDTTHLTTPAQKAAIDNAISGPNPISASNPLIADGIPVAVPRVVGVTTTTATDTVTITFGDIGGGNPFFGASVFTGKLGLDPSHSNRSSARNWFKLQDSFLAGYVDTDGPLFVYDVLDGTGSGSYNPAADATTSGIGYWSPAAPAASLRIKFNRALAAGKTVYISFYASGTISTLAPQNAYRPPATAQSMAADAYREINTAVINNALIGTGEASIGFVSAIGSAAAPGFQFRMPSGNLNGSGLYYIGDVTDSNYAFYNGIGVSAAGDTIAVFAKSSSGDNPALDSAAAPLVFEQFADATAVRYRMHVYEHTQGLAPAVLEFGTSSYSAGFNCALRVGKLSGTTVLGTEFTAPVRMASGVQLRLDTGTAAAPALILGPDAKSGLYEIGSYGNQDLSFYRAVGISLNSRTAFVFASNTPNVDGLAAGLDTPLMFEQFQNPDDGSAGYRIAITRTSNEASNASSIELGVAQYSADFTSWLSVSTDGVTTQNKLTAIGGLGFGISSYGALQATSASLTLAHGSDNVLSYGATAELLTLRALTTTLTGKLTLALGSEAAPAISFGTASDTGMFYIGNYTSGGVTTRRAVGFSVEGSVVLMLGRNEPNPGTIGALRAPLLIEQHVESDGTQAQLRLAAVDRSGASSALVLGTADYVNDFVPAITIDGSQIRLLQSVFVDGAFHAEASSFGGAISVTGNVTASGRVAGVGTTASAVGFSVSGSNTGLYGTGSSIGLAVAGSAVLSTSTVGGLHLDSPLGLTLGNKLTVEAGGMDVTGTAVFDNATFGGAVSIPAGASFTVGAAASFTGSVSFSGALTFGAITASSVTTTDLVATDIAATRGLWIGSSVSIDTQAAAGAGQYVFRIGSDFSGLFHVSTTQPSTGSIQSQLAIDNVEGVSIYSMRYMTETAIQGAVGADRASYLTTVQGISSTLPAVNISKGRFMIVDMAPLSFLTTAGTDPTNTFRYNTIAMSAVEAQVTPVSTPVYIRNVSTTERTIVLLYCNGLHWIVIS